MVRLLVLLAIIMSNAVFGADASRGCIFEGVERMSSQVEVQAFRGAYMCLYILLQKQGIWAQIGDDMCGPPHGRRATASAALALCSEGEPPLAHNKSGGGRTPHHA